MSNAADIGYINYLWRLGERYRQNTAGKPVFVANVPHDKVWNKYISSFEDPQYHNCFTCHSFLNRYAGLVTINDDGLTESALWNEDDCADDKRLRQATRWLKGFAEDGKITGVFYSADPVLGVGLTGNWRHFSVPNPAVHNRVATLQTDYQLAAEKAEEFRMLLRAVKEYNAGTVKEAVRLLEAGGLFRGERVLGAAKWFAEVYAKWAVTAAINMNNVLWRAVATAPTGFVHSARGGMLGTLLTDIQEGKTFDAIKASFQAKMDPTKYQRAQTAPKVGQVEAAEKAVAALGIAPAFERRYTKLTDLEPDGVLWAPNNTIMPPAEPKAAPKKSGVFDSLKPAADPAHPEVDIPPRTMTLEKFLRDVLPGALRIEYRVPLVGRFCALTTEANEEAPPILQWANPVSWAFPNPPATAQEWNLTPGALAPVRAIVQTPNMWDADFAMPHQGKGVILLLDGARDTRGLPGGGLFPEHLRNELKPYRATIEAHMNKLVVQGAEDPETFAFGIGLLEGNDWTERAAPVQVKPGTTKTAAVVEAVHAIVVIDNSGSMRSYLDAAREALATLVGGLAQMPGKVDVTVIRFGSTVEVLANRLPLTDRMFRSNMVTYLDGHGGQTALNDAIGRGLEIGAEWGRTTAREAFFMGIVTDGEENNSRVYSQRTLQSAIRELIAAGNWTIAYAGAGANPRKYAREVGIPEGNVTGFEASDAGFRDLGARYASSTRDLGTAYASGARATSSFFASATGTKAIGTDHPVLIVTNKSGSKSAYKIDRWE